MTEWYVRDRTTFNCTYLPGFLVKVALLDEFRVPTIIYYIYQRNGWLPMQVRTENGYYIGEIIKVVRSEEYYLDKITLKRCSPPDTKHEYPKNDRNDSKNNKLRITFTLVVAIPGFDEAGSPHKACTCLILIT